MAITRIQTNHFEDGISLTTIAVSLTGIAVGALIVVTVTCDTGAGSTVTSVKDDLNVAAVQRVAINNTGFNQRKEIWRFQNHGGGTRTFTATFSPAATNRGITVREYAGAHTTAVDDGIASATATSATPSSGTLSPAPSVNGELIVGGITSTQLPTPAAPFSDVFQDTANVGDTSDYIQPTAAAIAATWTQTSGAYSAIAASFFPAAVGGGGTGNRLMLENGVDALLLEGGAGTLLLESVSGTAQGTIPKLTLAGSASVDETATLTASIPKLTFSMQGAVDVGGTMPSRALPMLLISGASATVAIAGTMAPSIPKLTLSSQGTVAITGTMQASIPKLTFAAQATVPIAGTHSPVLPMLTMSAQATLPITGTMQAALPMLSMSAQASGSNVTDSGILAATLPMLTVAVTATQSIAGTMAPTLPMLVAALSADVSGGGPVLTTGALTATMPQLLATFTATVITPAPPSVNLPPGATRVLFDPSRLAVRFEPSRTRITLDPSRTRVI